MEQILSKIEEGEVLSDAELKRAIKWFSDLEEKLRLLGSKYYLAWAGVRRTLLGLEEISFWRKKS